MAGFHIGRNGPARCRAKIKCPLGGVSGNEDHFSTMKEAESGYDEKMQKHLFSSNKKSDLKVHRRGIAKKKSERFNYLDKAELEDLRKRARRDADLILSYEHDYSKDNPDSRPGEREYLNTYDLSKFGGRDTSSDLIAIKKSAKNSGLEVLMVERGNHPYKDTWAHPGGFLNYNETVAEGGVREVREEAGVYLSEDQIEFVKHYDHPDRDPRGALKMNTNLVILPVGTNPTAGDDAKKAKFVPIRDVYNGKLEICADHRQSIRDAIAYLLEE